MRLFYAEGMGKESLYAPSQGFNQRREDGAMESAIFLGIPGNGFKMKLAALERSYEIITGDSARNVVPTQAQINQVVAAREQ